MLSPHPPMNDSPEEKARYERDLQNKRENPSNWGYARTPDAQSDRRAIIAGAMTTIIANGEELGKDGKPDLERVNEIVSLPEPVSVKERDAIWAVIQGQSAKIKESKGKGKGKAK